jgi:hypothetical protein
MPHVRQLALLGLLVSLLCPRAAYSAEVTELKFHPAKGSAVRLKVSLDQTITQTSNGVPATVSQTVTLVYGMAATDVAADGTTTVKVSYDAIAFKQRSNLGNVDYDSSTPAPVIPAAAKGLAAVVGQAVTIKVTPTGHVTDVQGVDELIDAILKRLEIPDGPTKPILESSLRKEFGQDAIRDNMETMLLIYPDKPVAVGDTWSRRLAIAKGFSIVIENAFTLKESNADVATVAVKSKLSSNADAPPIDMGNRKLTYELSGEQSGVLKINRSDGMIRAAEMKQKITGKMISEAGGAKTEVPLVIETKMTMGLE